MANEIYPVSWWWSPVQNGWGGIYYDFAYPSAGDTTSFITTWRTTTSSETITIPTRDDETYNYDISTSDGQTFTGVSGNQTITFASAGDYDISISGDFPRIYFNNGGDKNKIIDIKQWGNISWTSFLKAFFGCQNMQITASDAPDLTNVTVLQNAFRQTAVQLNLSNWDVSNIEVMRGMLQDTLLNENISSWDITSVINFQDFMKTTNTLTTSNYDAILIGWEATLQATYPNGSGYSPTISISFGGAEYTGSGASASARASLINNFNWTITDGGIA